MKEVWKNIRGYKGTYQVSNLGRVKSFSRYKEGVILKPAKASHGYFTVVLGRGNTRTLHSLVAGAFIGPCPKGQEVRHKDGTRTNNILTNLEYGTRSQNNVDASIAGKRKLTVEIVLEIRKHRGVLLLRDAKELGLKYGVSYHCIYDALKGKSWKHVRCI